METNTELLNRIEAHIKGRLAVAESRAASSELYEGKKIAYNSILGFVNSLRADLASQIHLTPIDVTAEVQEAAEKYDEKATEIALKTTSPFQEELTGPAPTYSDAFEAGAEWQRERLMKEAPAADVVEMHGSTDAEYPLVLTFGFLKIPRFEFSGKPVRVIIEEIK